MTSRTASASCPAGGQSAFEFGGEFGLELILGDANRIGFRFEGEFHFDVIFLRAEDDADGGWSSGAQVESLHIVPFRARTGMLASLDAGHTGNSNGDCQ
jgi:hypothetical protein